MKCLPNMTSVCYSISQSTTCKIFVVSISINMSNSQEIGVYDRKINNFKDVNDFLSISD